MGQGDAVAEKDSPGTGGARIGVSRAVEVIDPRPRRRTQDGRQGSGVSGDFLFLGSEGRDRVDELSFIEPKSTASRLINLFFEE